MMLNRREFVYGTVASVLTFARSPAAFATDYDFIIKGGGSSTPHYTSTRSGTSPLLGAASRRSPRISTSGAAEVIDATGKLVVPGLLDVHCHSPRDDDGPHIGCPTA